MRKYRAFLLPHILSEKETTFLEIILSVSIEHIKLKIILKMLIFFYCLRFIIIELNNNNIVL